MCLSNNHYDGARIGFAKSVLVGLEISEIVDGERTDRRLLAYSNQITSHIGADAKNPNDDFGWGIPAPITKLGNALLIAVPAAPGSILETDLIPMSRYPWMVKDMVATVTEPATLSLSPTRSWLLPQKALVVSDFDAGLYDVVIASSASAIAGTLRAGRVNPTKMPEIRQELYEQLDLLYPGFQFVLFCFNEKDVGKTGTVMFRYTPMKGSEHLLYLPGLDGHNGEVEQGLVKLDHTIIAGSYRMNDEAGEKVDYSDRDVEKELPWLKDCRIIGTCLPQGIEAPQGDFLMLLNEVREGTLRIKRQLPPGWANVFGEVPDQAPHFIRPARTSRY
ncbi:MAG TPA: hypothetical protein PL112_21905 [Candidatus Obscuribacter sp.]|nr:hypothetical protein [Candidatus Obscuribacter sp.]